MRRLVEHIRSITIHIKYKLNPILLKLDRDNIISDFFSKLDPFSSIPNSNTHMCNASPTSSSQVSKSGSTTNNLGTIQGDADEARTKLLVEKVWFS